MADKEIEQFKYFIKYQLANLSTKTGQIDTWSKISNQYGSVHKRRLNKDIGSKNDDGYIRVWCGNVESTPYGRNLRMKHRLLWFIHYGYLPEKGYEIDHIDGNRSNNSLGNLQILSKSANNAKRKITTKKGEIKDTTIHQVCKWLANTELSDMAIAKHCNISRPYVRDIKIRKKRINISSQYVWEHRGY